MLKKYLFLTKPGILFGNFITTLGGFFLAAQGTIDSLLLLITLVGTTLVVASGCVINNIIDQDIDHKMQRTQNRALVKKTIHPQSAMLFAVVLGLVGFAALWFLVNVYAFAFALLGFVVYVGFYSLWSKRHSIHQTVIGSLSGASPPVIGYTAVMQQFDVAALLLFLAYAFWQMPHSWAIAIYRFDDYKNAGIPILPVARSFLRTKVESLIYIVLFTCSINALFFFGYVNLLFTVMVNLLCAYWLWLSILGFQCTDNTVWAKKLFLFSVILITVMSLSFSFGFNSPYPQLPIF